MNKGFGFIIFLGDVDTLVVELESLFKIMSSVKIGRLFYFGLEIIHDSKMNESNYSITKNRFCLNVIFESFWLN